MATTRPLSPFADFGSALIISRAAQSSSLYFGRLTAHEHPHERVNAYRSPWSQHRAETYDPPSPQALLVSAGPSPLPTSARRVPELICRDLYEGFPLQAPASAQ